MGQILRFPGGPHKHRPETPHIMRQPHSGQLPPHGEDSKDWLRGEQESTAWAKQEEPYILENTKGKRVFPGKNYRLFQYGWRTGLSRRPREEVKKLAGALSWRCSYVTHSFLPHIFLAHILGPRHHSRPQECSSEQSAPVPISCGVRSSEGSHASKHMTRRGQPRHRRSLSGCPIHASQLSFQILPNARSPEPADLPFLAADDVSAE